MPTGAIALLLSAWTLTNVANTRGRKIDWTGSFLSIMGVTSFLLAIQGGGAQWAWDSWQSTTLFVTSAVSILLFVGNELRVPEPILDLSSSPTAPLRWPR